MRASATGARRTVFIVPHTHWDREWYFTTQQSRALLLETLPVVLAELERGRLPCFVLDGQTALLEDYLRMAPDNHDRIASLVAGGRLLIGPWYTQTDQCVVGSESIARNLLYGVRDSREFGGHMPVAYVPDSFGQTAQLPQILSQFGFDRCVFWRGWWDGVSAASEFRWSSRDGSRVTAAVIRSGYAGVKGMPDGDDWRSRRLDQIRGLVESQAGSNATRATLVMGGNDQQPWDPRLPGLLDEENERQGATRYELGDFNGFFDCLDESDELETVTGEMLAGKHSRIHRGIYSTRYDVKKANADAETLITHGLEPVLAIGWSLGMPYPHGLLETAWKKLLKSHAHDSIGCCNTDEVNRAVKQRFLDAYQMCRQALRLRMRQIAERVVPEQEGERLLLFNTLPEPRSGPVEADLVVEHEATESIQIVDAAGAACPFESLDCRPVQLSELVQDLAAALQPGQGGDPLLFRHRLLIDAGSLPPLGYKTLYVRSVGSDSGRGAAVALSSGATEIINEHLRVRVDEDGTVSLRDLRSGREFSGLLEFVDGGDDGDNYDFSPPRKDWFVSTCGRRPAVEARCGKLRQSLLLRWRLTVPAGLAERAERRASVPLSLEARLDLDRGRDFVDVRVEVDNRARDHRLQALFRTGLDTSDSWADQPFGMIRRSSRPPELADWEDPAQQERWTSRPLPLYPMQSLVAMRDDSGGFAVMTDGIREYETDAARPGDLAITLFRSVGFMGKPDLLYRPGRLSGMPTPTPDSQLQGRLAFRFALAPFTGEPASLSRLARRYLSRVRCHHVNGYDRFSINRGPVDLPGAYSLMRFESPLAVSAIKKAEGREALVVRAFNASVTPADAGRLEPEGNGWNDAVIRRSNLNEDPGEVLEAGRLGDEAGPQQVLTYLIERPDE